MFDEDHEEECGSIIGDILVGFGIFFLVVGFFKFILAAIEAVFVLLSFAFNCILCTTRPIVIVIDSSSSSLNLNSIVKKPGRIRELSRANRLNYVGTKVF
ncbi:hypothetical protein [Vibrio gallicus]|uniref:hypothetical protein n=1 Tax=Vibrio gallicus TaxID=190897 RepID=UPI0021C365FD|nr:hypothetical protein [Vibrio gallicus]